MANVKICYGYISFQMIIVEDIVKGKVYLKLLRRL